MGLALRVIEVARYRACVSRPAGDLELNECRRSVDRRYSLEGPSVYIYESSSGFASVNCRKLSCDSPTRSASAGAGCDRRRIPPREYQSHGYSADGEHQSI